MPCRTYEDDPTSRQAETSKVCGYLVWILRKLNREVPHRIWCIVQHPCEANYAEGDEYTAQLCELLRSLPSEIVAQITKEYSLIGEWWEHHQAWDRECEQRT